MEFLLFNEVLKSLIFFPIKKVGFITLILSKLLICGQFIPKDLNLWSTILFVRFEKFSGPLNLLEPSKKTQLLDS